MPLGNNPLLVNHDRDFSSLRKTGGYFRAINNTTEAAQKCRRACARDFSPAIVFYHDPLIDYGTTDKNVFFRASAGPAVFV